MNIIERIQEWEKGDGVQAFRAIGVREGACVLDFGFGQGHFTVCAANAVGPAGRVFALDADPAAVEALLARVAREGLAAIEVRHTDGGTKIGLADASVDCVLFYDLLHMPGLNRPELITEAHRVLHHDGVLSILPFHMGEDDVQRLLMDIESAGFASPKKLPDAGLHFGMLSKANEANPAADFDTLGKGTFYNFTRI